VPQVAQLLRSSEFAKSWNECDGEPPRNSSAERFSEILLNVDQPAPTNSSFDDSKSWLAKVGKSDGKHFLHFVAKMIDDLDADAGFRWLRKRPRDG
jgi:hypothetical protein